MNLRSALFAVVLPFACAGIVVGCGSEPSDGLGDDKSDESSTGDDDDDDAAGDDDDSPPGDDDDDVPGDDDDDDVPGDDDDVPGDDDDVPEDDCAEELGNMVDEQGRCCGCLCDDPSWSCSEDTCLEGGVVTTLAPEAGFFEFPASEYRVNGFDMTSPRDRVWYMFRPADEAPETKPIALFFNGGPGSTASFLFAFNTNYWTFAPDVAGGDGVVENPHSWTRFANVMYIDPSNTGFSYVLPTTDGERAEVDIFDADRDSALYLRTLLKFLAKHPSLRSNRIVLAGESWGGTRANLILHKAYGYQDLDDANADYQDIALQTAMVKHLEAVFPDDDPAAVGPQRLAEQFSHQVLVQPTVAWRLEQAAEDRVQAPPCVGEEYDYYQCDKPSSWTFDNIYAMEDNFLQPQKFETAIGVDPRSIRWMNACARGRVYGRPEPGTSAAPASWSTTFGPLNGGDEYYVGISDQIWVGDNSRFREVYGEGSDGPELVRLFLHHLRYVNTFITNGLYDTVVWSHTIPLVLGDHGDTSRVVHDEEPRPDVDRAGWVQVDYAAGEPMSREIRFPFYEKSGHMVTLVEPGEIHDDVAVWLDETI